jgi:hypothetical protein
VEHTETSYLPGELHHDWIAVDVQSPKAVQSNHVPYSVDCTDSTTTAGSTEGSGTDSGSGSASGTETASTEGPGTTAGAAGTPGGSEAAADKS